MWKVFNFRSRYLVYGKLGGSARVSLDMFLQHQSVWVALLADETLMKCSHWSSDLVNTHVGLQVALSCEASLTYFALVGPLARVSSVVHL